MPHDTWWFIGIVLLVVAAVWAIRDREWLWFAIATGLLFYAVPNAFTVLTTA